MHDGGQARKPVAEDKKVFVISRKRLATGVNRPAWAGGDYAIYTPRISVVVPGVDLPFSFYPKTGIDLSMTAVPRFSAAGAALSYLFFPSPYLLHFT